MILINIPLFPQRNHKRILAFIDEVYRWLPLGSVLNSRVLIVHGGFSDSTSLDLIKSIDRGKVNLLYKWHKGIDF